MTTITKLVTVLAAFAVSSSAFAQTEPAAPAEASSASVLGQRYAEYNLGFVDVNHSRTDAFGAGLTVNLPVVSNIDVSVDYTYGWAESHSDVDSHVLNVDGIYFIDAGKLKPFGGVTLGYGWSDWNDDWFWGVFGGVEYQINSKISVAASAGYDADFDDADEGAFDGTVTGRYFFTRTIAAAASVSLIEGGNIGYSAGVTLKF